MPEAGPPPTGWVAAPANWAPVVSGRLRPCSSRILPLLRSLLDFVITAYAAGLVLVAATGGIDLGVVSAHDAAKPLFMLLVLVPVRIAFGGPSWLVNRLHWVRAHTVAPWAVASARVPAAIVDSAFALVTVRLATMAAAFLANIVFEPATARGFTLPFSNSRFVEIFAAWDSGWYWDIAMRGYYFRPDAQSSIAFFPLYPMLMRAVAAPFGGGAGATWIAGIAVSMTAYLLALCAIHRFTERLFGSREVARRTVLYIVVFPWSIFLSRVYSESVFLLVTVLAISRAYDSRWWHAGMWGALATLTRPNGILIALPLVLLALRDRPNLRETASRLAQLIPIPVAMAGYCAYVYTIMGDPLGWMTAQSYWGYSLGHPPWQQLQRMIGALLEHGPYGYFFMSDIAPFELLHGTSALIFLALTPLVFRHLGTAMGTYVLASLLVPLSSNTLEGLGRYASVLFPAFMLVASVTSARAHEAIVMMSLVLRTLIVCLFVTWQPIY